MQASGHLIFIKRDGRDGSVYPVTTPTCSVGRGLDNDVRIHAQSVSQEHCKIYTSEFRPAVLRNLSSTNPTKINDVPIRENEHRLEHGDLITTGERSFRWEYPSHSHHYIPTLAKSVATLSTSPLRGSTGMVGMPISVLQSALGNRSFNRRSVVGTESKKKLSPGMMTSGGRTPSKSSVSMPQDVSFNPSERLVAIVSPQRRSLSEKKVNEAATPSQKDEGSGLTSGSSRKLKSVASSGVTNASSPSDKSVVELSNQSAAKKHVNSTPSRRKSNRLCSKSVKKTAGSNIGVKTFYNRRSLQALVATRKAPLSSAKARKSTGGSLVSIVSHIPKLVKPVSKISKAKTPRSSKKSMSNGNLKTRSPATSAKKIKQASEEKIPVAVTVQETKRKLESGLLSAERAAKRLKLESPKTPDKNKMAALLVCHGKASRPRTPQIILPDSNWHVADIPEGKSKSPAAASRSRGSAIQETTRKKANTSRTSTSDSTSSSHAFSTEIPTHFNFGSKAADLSEPSGWTVNESLLRVAQKSRRSRTIMLEQTVSPKLEDATNMSGIAELFNSPVGVTYTQKTPSVASVDTGHPSSAVLSIEKATTTRDSRSSRKSGVSVGFASDISIGVSPNKKTPEHNARQSLFEKFMRKSVQSDFGEENTENSESPQSLLSTSRAESTSKRRSRSLTVGSPVTSGQTSTRKSRSLAKTQTPKSVSRSPSIKFSSSPEFEDKVLSVTPSSTFVSKRTTSARNSRVDMPSPESVKSNSQSPPEAEDRRSVSLNTLVSKTSTSARSSRVVTPSPKLVESDLRSPPGIKNEGRSVYPGTPASKRNTSPRKSSGTGVVISFPRSVDQNSSSLGLRKVSPSLGGRRDEVISTPITSLSKRVSSPRKSSPLVNLSLDIVEQDFHSSGSRFSKSPHVPKSSDNVRKVSPSLGGRRDEVISTPITSPFKRVSSTRKSSPLGNLSLDIVEQGPHSSGSRFSKSSDNARKMSQSLGGRAITPLSKRVLSPTKSSPVRNLSLDIVEQGPHSSGSRFSNENSSSTKRVSWSHANQTQLASPDSLNTTFDFDSIKTPRIPLEDFVSPLFSNRKRSNVRWQSTSMSEQKAKSEPAVKRRRLSGRFDGNATFSGGSAVNLLAPQQLFTLSLSDESINSSWTQRKELRSANSSISDEVKMPLGGRISPKKASPNVHSVQMLMKVSPKISQSNGDSSSRRPKSPKNDLSYVRGVRQLIKTPRSQKSPKNDLTDVRGVKALMASPRTQKSPLNDLTDVRGVRRLMATPRLPKSPKNDLTDVYGVKELMATPRSPRPIKNNLTDVHVGKMPPSPHSPKFGGHASGAQSKSKIQENKINLSSGSGEVPTMARRTRHRIAVENVTPIKCSPKLLKTEIDEADKSGAEVDQKNVPMLQEVKTSNTRSRRNRKEPELTTVKAEITDGSPKSPPKKRRQREKKIENADELLSEDHVEIPTGFSDTSVASGGTRSRVRFNIPDSPVAPVTRVTRGKRGVAYAEIEMPSPLTESRKTQRSKGNVKTGKAIEDYLPQVVSSPSIRKTRCTKLTSAAETSSSPARRKRGAEVVADIESSSSPERKRGAAVSAKVEPDLPSRKQQDSSTPSVVTSSPPKRRRVATVTTDSEVSTPSRRRRGTTLAADTELSPPRRLRGATAPAAEFSSPPRRRRGAKVIAEDDVPQSPVIKKTRGKSAPAMSSPAVTSTAMETDSVTTNSSPPPARRAKRGAKPVETQSPAPARKLRGTKSSDVPEEDATSGTKTRNKKTRVVSSPISEAQSPPSTSKRGGKRTKKTETSPQATAERQTRSSRRKK